MEYSIHPLYEISYYDSKWDKWHGETFYSIKAFVLDNYNRGEKFRTSIRVENTFFQFFMDLLKCLN